MKFKLLCDRCIGDKKAFRHYTNPYNNGKCHKCNGYGYILTKDEAKAKASHIKYLETLQRVIKGIEIETNKEVNVIEELNKFREKHQRQHKEVHAKFEEIMEKAAVAYKNNLPEFEHITEEIKKMNEQLKETETEEYKKELRYLEIEVRDAKKVKEKAIKRMEEVQKFYMELLQTVE